MQGVTAFPEGAGYGLGTRVSAVSTGDSGVGATANGADFRIGDLDSGSYTLTAEGAGGFLEAEKTGVGINGPPQSTDLKTGNTNGDPWINLTDILITIASNGTSTHARIDSGGRYVDHDASGVVNITDIDLAIANFGLTEPRPW